MSAADEWSAYLRTFPPREASFVEKRYAVGQLPEDIAADLHAAITGAAHFPIANDIVNGVAAAPLPVKTLAALNAQHVYRWFDEPTANALRRALLSLKETIAELLNTPWRVLNCRSWTTVAGEKDFGPNVWHQDGDIKELLKVMFYASETGGELGGLELKAADGVQSISGPPGRWVLFYNSKITHRGVAPKKEGHMRVATEVGIAPAREFDLEPRFLGNIARYPLKP